MSLGKTVTFGQFAVQASQVFYRSRLSLGLVNLMPVLKGHVLVIPRRRVMRFKDLTDEEIADLFVATRQISTVIEREYNATALTIAVQDGKEAGQTVSHVHVHVIPRHGNDFPQNDQVYTELENKEKERIVVEEPQRPKRSEADMAAEATFLSQFFPENDKYSLD
eukprot:TRINITY_DN26895_c0_g1_i1.p1 TRINITY_DN26895_c0_g1~~TRINITY_DN26895_c0_g1_i1.p1  ORF type:complete len:165 (+),score=54.70 TRINITY_DN26895_c0_g1_i1:143-637(+)